ncbi:MAG: type IV pilus modification protein PilV [Thauera sp.]
MKNAFQTGVSLLEVLIAVVVLSLGFLGLAGLQLNSLRNNESSFQRSFAVVETYTIADAMRADRFKAESNGLGGSQYLTNAGNQWVTRLKTTLGADATGTVACNGSLCTITITWNDSRGTGGNAQHSLVTEIQL